jgi:lipopolysaccharide/colanic/teichoic acid biosynthesis glycosyltransferase
MAAPVSFASGLNEEILNALRGEWHAIPRSLLQKVMVLSKVLADFLTCAGGIFAACFLYPTLHIGHAAATSIVVGLLMVLLLKRDSSVLLEMRATEHALRITAQSLLFLLLCSFFFHLNVPYEAFLIALILLPLLLIFEKRMIFAIMRILLSNSPLKVRPSRESRDIGGLLLSSTPFHYAFAKRAVDVIVSSLLLLLLAPVLFLIAVLVWLDSPGPILFVQKRVGRNGELFDIYKFRSMHTTAPRYGLSPTQSCDPRITAVGRFLRRSSLDELPQLINVFLGEMSLVGPRPEMPFIVRRYDSQQRQRLQVAPGITGLWQLSADRAFPIHDNIQHDLSYIKNRSFFMDLAILLHTPLRALRGGV